MQQTSLKATLTEAQKAAMHRPAQEVQVVILDNDPETARALVDVLREWPGHITPVVVIHESLEAPAIPPGTDILLLDSEFFVEQNLHAQMNGAIAADHLRAAGFAGLIGAIPTNDSHRTEKFAEHVWRGKTHLRYGFTDAVDNFIAFMNKLLGEL